MTSSGGGQGTVLKAPFPVELYPGGKAKVADLVWKRLGNCDNFVEPFMGSLAVLLRRPADHFADGYRVETANDINGYIVNFWRAAKNAPEKVAEFADSPVIEADLHARHRWLVRSKTADKFREKMRTDPDYFDAKIAGWWCWGACCWIGSGWCSDGVDWKQPFDFDGGRGVLGSGRPQLTDAFDIGRGVNGHATAGTCDDRREWLTDWMKRLADRLRLVRTCYGHWSRICDSDSTMTRLGLTGAFLDPPYPARRGDTGEKSRDDNLYANDKTQDLDALRDEVLAWCRKWTGPQVRIAVCGYEGDGYESLEQEGWSVESWTANGGYGNQRKGKGKSTNADRERIWFSPSCISDVDEPNLFTGMDP